MPFGGSYPYESSSTVTSSEVVVVQAHSLIYVLFLFIGSVPTHVDEYGYYTWLLAISGKFMG
jgi:hypothetical protein